MEPVRPDRLPLGKDEMRGGWVAVKGHPPNGASGSEKFRLIHRDLTIGSQTAYARGWVGTKQPPDLGGTPPRPNQRS